MAEDHLKEWGYSVNWEAVENLEDEKEKKFAKSLLKYMQENSPEGTVTGRQILNSRDWYSEYIKRYELPGMTFLINLDDLDSEMECVNCHELFKRMSKEKQAVVYFIMEALDSIDVYGQSLQSVIGKMDRNEWNLLTNIIKEKLIGKPEWRY